jgi:toxin CptA
VSGLFDATRTPLAFMRDELEDMMLSSWLIAPALAAIAGFSLSRGGICAVAAVRQVIEERRWRLFISFLECAAWALLALIIADALGLKMLGAWPARMMFGAAMLGGALFGLGALVVGACAFGAAGRLAAGEISFFAVVPGFLLGVVGAHRVGADAGAPAPAAFALHGAALLMVSITLGAFALWRISTAWRARAQVRGFGDWITNPNWPPAVAMAVIAFANVGLLLLVLSWPYTTLLTDLAFRRGAELVFRAVLVGVFVLGAFAGSLLAGRFSVRLGSLRHWGQRFMGGVLMGMGAALIPGGNDALVLMGLPLMQPEAFAAYGAMIAIITAGVLAQRAFTRRTPSRAR